MSPALSILVPAFDEAENLAVHLPIMMAEAEACTPDHEILVVDDGSRDDTAGLIERLARKDPRLRLVRHPRNLGPGSGIATGLFWARGEWLMFLPADLACAPEDIGRLWRARQGVDLVVGLRSDRSDYSLWRKLLSVTYIGLIQHLTGSRTRQFNYIQLYRRSIFGRVAVRSRGVFVTAEIILGAEAAGLRLRELPMRYLARSRGQARGARLGVIARCGLDLAGHLAGRRRFFAWPGG